MNPRRLDFVIDRQWAGRPVHDLLRRKLGLSGTLLRRIKWLEDGILLDGQRVHTRVIVREGQTLSVRLSDPTVKSGIPPVSLPLDVVYEDRDIAVVNKAPGMPSHPGPGHWQDSLGNALMSHWQETDPDADFHPVHRLDKGTSGLMVVAKHPFAQEELRKALHSGRFRRQYLAICEGVLSPGQGVIDRLDVIRAGFMPLLPQLAVFLGPASVPVQYHSDMPGYFSFSIHNTLPLTPQMLTILS